MSGFDPIQVSQLAANLARTHFLEELSSLFDTSEAIIRRGAAGLLEPKLSPAQRTATRKRLESLAQIDPDSYSKELRNMIAATSLQEVLTLMTGGKLPGQGGAGATGRQSY